MNIAPAERIATGLAGGAAIAFGVGQRSVRGMLLAGVGAIAMMRAISGRCPLYRSRAARKGIQVRRAITIQCTPQKAYEVWRDLANLPQFMTHVQSVTLEEGGVSKWVVKEGGKELTWRAELIEDTPARRLRWKSLPGGDISHEGSIDIRWATGDRGTIVEVKMRYFPPGGLLVASALYGFLRKLTAAQIGAELARFQQLIETGELTTGARRVRDLDEDDKAISAQQVSPLERALDIGTSAETSTWTGATNGATNGGAR
ncbi:MAG: SRPBCC family protein [Deltaproteobacteria bacterium]|nr:SRPBCC family protein [Deltaproteobacteria bacterium]MDQ3297693.1 SRPBCC family protein [Myxococcota bacterium]